MEYTYKTSGTCSQAIVVDIDGDTVNSVQFVGGCNGNTQGVASLVKGMKIDEVEARLKGIKCGFRNTSCPDQLCYALREAQANS